MVLHEQNGLLVPFGDVEALSRAVGRVLDDRDYARQLASRGNHRIARGYTWDDRFATLMGRTQDAIRQRRRGFHAKTA